MEPLALTTQKCAKIQVVSYMHLLLLTEKPSWCCFHTNELLVGSRHLSRAGKGLRTYTHSVSVPCDFGSSFHPEHFSQAACEANLSKSRCRRPRKAKPMFYTLSSFLKDLFPPMCVCVRVHACGGGRGCAPECPWRPQEDVRFSGAGVTGACEPPNVSTRDYAIVHRQSTLNHWALFSL